MKNLRLTFVALLIATLFSGCDAFEEADDVSFDASFTLPQALVVNETADNPANPYTSLVTTLAIDDAQYDKYKDRIKEVKVNKIEYTITDYAANGPVTLTKGDAIFFGVGESAASGKIASVSNVSLSNHTGELQAEAGAIEKIQNILAQNGEVFVTSKAILSDAPVYFKISVTVHTTIKANALK